MSLATKYRKVKRTAIGAVFLALLGAGGGLFYVTFSSTGDTIFHLLTENKRMKEAISNLTEHEQIGYARVLDQTTQEGTLYTRLLFVVTDPEDQTRRLLEKEYTIEGDVVHFDALIVRFDPVVVMDGKAKTLYLWRRIYGEEMKPSEGYPIEIVGEEPKRYAEFFEQLDVNKREMFWDEIWKLANDPQHLKSAGIEAIYGEAVYTRVKPGLIYEFNLSPDGAFTPKTVPAL